MPASIDAATKDRLTAAGKTAIQTVARAGVPALRQVLPRGLSTRVARHGGHLRHAGRRASTTRTAMQVLHHHRQPRCGAHPQHRPRGSEAHPRRDGRRRSRASTSSARSDQFLQLHPQRSALLFTRRPEELFAAYEKTARGIEPQLPKLFGSLPKTRLRHPPDSGGQRAHHDHGVLPAAVARRLARRAITT